METEVKQNNKIINLFVLPSDNKEMTEFINKHRVKMIEHTVDSIEYALQNKVPVIELFQFRNSDFVITLSDKDFQPNLDLYYQYYISEEKYEMCSRIVQLQKLLTKGIKLDEKQNC